MVQIHVVHATSPGCHWSWGYEATINRLRLVYGDQIRLYLGLAYPYEDWQQWLKDYGMSESEAVEWVADMGKTMDVPLGPMVPGKIPKSMLPAALAAFAAVKLDERKGWRFHRALLRMYAVEGKDPSSEASIVAAATESGIDARKVLAELGRGDELRAELDSQEGPPVHVGFYNVVVWDGENRRVTLDHAFEPSVVEGAIDYLSGGTLRKTLPTDVRAYLHEHGLAPLSEIRRVFATSDKDALARLEALEKEGKAERVTLAGAPHWRATS